MIAWQEIVNAALVGTERQPFAPPAQSAPLNALCEQLSGESQERALLGVAAVIALYERAGRLPAKATNALAEACPPDDAPRCGERAAQHLKLMLGGEYTQVLPEWLRALAQAGRRVPEECLPALLDAGKVQEALRDAITAVIGKRGAWLAAQNADWSYAVEKFDETQWETDGSIARLAFIKRLRASDPARARELVAKAWDESTPKDRADFIATFYTGLSMQDEPFLEGALDDRSTVVRRAAADVLKWLPESALVRRMIERVKASVRFEKRLFGRVEIHATLPDKRTPVMMRDGITTKPILNTMGEKAWLWSQMIEAVPLDFWRQESGCDLPELLRAAKKSEWEELLLEAWSNAALRNHQPDALALIGFRASTHQPYELIERLSQNSLEAIALRILRAHPALDGQHPAFPFLDRNENQWGKELSLAALRSLALPESEMLFHSVRFWVVNFAARHLNAACIPDAVAVFSSLSSADRRIQARLGQYLKDLEFRQDMLKEINR